MYLLTCVSWRNKNFIKNGFKNSMQKCKKWLALYFQSLIRSKYPKSNNSFNKNVCTQKWFCMILDIRLDVSVAIRKTVDKLVPKVSIPKIA